MFVVVWALCLCTVCFRNPNTGENATWGRWVWSVYLIDSLTISRLTVKYIWNNFKAKTRSCVYQTQQHVTYSTDIVSDTSEQLLIVNRWWFVADIRHRNWTLVNLGWNRRSTLMDSNHVHCIIIRSSYLLQCQHILLSW